MAKIAVLEMKVDVQMALNNLKSKDRKELIRENLSLRDVDDLIDEFFQRRDINKVMEYFSRTDIMYWLEEHAEEYGYTKRGIRIYKNGGLKQ